MKASTKRGKLATLKGLVRKTFRLYDVLHSGKLYQVPSNAVEKSK